ncbi:hypothetical protein NDU88_002050 [Pleurodeles waltl]|uniref:Uncharacterized protein n=1 Tax=Pleurodeles waltl TaxID=8319 RepID=A0AAV7LB85_PLEWA|nr:hypothetical protein NDU88_002050 [Pleurodeles waltl]
MPIHDHRSEPGAIKNQPEHDPEAKQKKGNKPLEARSTTDTRAKGPTGPPPPRNPHGQQAQEGRQTLETGNNSNLTPPAPTKRGKRGERTGNKQHTNEPKKYGTREAERTTKGAPRREPIRAGQNQRSNMSRGTNGIQEKAQPTGPAGATGNSPNVDLPRQGRCNRR